MVQNSRKLLYQTGGAFPQSLFTGYDDSDVSFNAARIDSVGNLHVDSYVAPGRQLDGFDALRVSYKSIVFEYSGKYDNGPLLWETNLTGTGSTIFNSGDGSNTISTGGTASGAKAIRQTHAYMIYTAGKSRMAVIGVLYGDPATNLRRRSGMFDADNGIFLEQISTGIRFVIRSNSGGSPVDTAIDQANWNIDKLDGTGKSGQTLNLAASQGLILEYTGYNLASCRLGFLMGGDIIYAHKIINQNAMVGFGIGTGCLPIRYEIENIGTTSGTNTMKASSCAVWDEDGVSSDFAYAFSANMGTTEKSVTTRVPIISIRPKVTFNGITTRCRVRLTRYKTAARTNTSLIEVVRNGTLTGPSWTSANANSIAEYDITASAITGGDVIASDYSIAGLGSSGDRLSEVFQSRYGLFNDFAGTTPDRLSIVATSLTGTSALLASMEWEEDR